MTWTFAAKLPERVHLLTERRGDGRARMAQITIIASGRNGRMHDLRRLGLAR
ncbi:hypothetical protein [Gordonia sp. i37]|uniref:hypothetical protein n=1 Tax=Gordonia sp. i37 TaxID=1961707 RepID=UPI0015546AFE|nr:hypothetical protein [Gordonia sp. i37]